LNIRAQALLFVTTLE